MRALITGAAGFVGRHMTQQCVSQGATVIGVGREPAESLDGLDSYLQAELLESAQVEQVMLSANPDLVFHLAADASVAGSWEEPERVMTANLVSTLNVLEAVRRDAPDARVLVACSGEEYGPPQSLPVDESHLLRPQNPYAVSKVAVDHAAGFYADAYGLRIVRTRSFNHAGPGQSPAYVISAFASQIAEAERDGTDPFELVTGNTKVRRDFTDVRDVVRAYWLALDRCEPGVYNVCSGKSVAIEEILGELIALANVEVRPRVDERLLRPNDVPDVHGTSARLREASGWEPQLSLRETLSDTLAWWREQVNRTRGVKVSDE